MGLCRTHIGGPSARVRRGDSFVACWCSLVFLIFEATIGDVCFLCLLDTNVDFVLARQFTLVGERVRFEVSANRVCHFCCV